MRCVLVGGSPFVAARCVSNARNRNSRSHLGVVFEGGQRSKGAGYCTVL